VWARASGPLTCAGFSVSMVDPQAGDTFKWCHLKQFAPWQGCTGKQASTGWTFYRREDGCSGGASDTCEAKLLSCEAKLSSGACAPFAPPAAPPPAPPLPSAPPSPPSPPSPPFPSSPPPTPPSAPGLC
jgi:hypothetical protein